MPSITTVAGPTPLQVAQALFDATHGPVTDPANPTGTNAIPNIDENLVGSDVVIFQSTDGTNVTFQIVDAPTQEDRGLPGTKQYYQFSKVVSNITPPAGNDPLGAPYQTDIINLAQPGDPGIFFTPQVKVERTSYSVTGNQGNTVTFYVLGYNQSNILLGGKSLFATAGDPALGEPALYSTIDAFVVIGQTPVGGGLYTNLTPSIDGIYANANNQYMGQLFPSSVDNPITIGTSFAGTVTTPPCFVTGTRITTPSGEIAVEKLAIGDLVTTVSGAAMPIRWIGRRSYGIAATAFSEAVRPVTIRAGALGVNVPARDLSVSPEHAMLIDGVMVPAAALVNGVSIVRARATVSVGYVHLELDGHEAILAEGAPTETFADIDSRAMFANAAEFTALYGEETIKASPFVRVEQGETVETIRRAIAQRAGLTTTAMNAPGPLAGRLEVAHVADGTLHIEGWAMDTANPGRPVHLDVTVGGTSAAVVIANRYRGDLADTGHAEGRCGFSLSLPARPGAVVVVRSLDGAVLQLVEGFRAAA